MDSRAARGHIRDRIERGATLDELDSVIRARRGLDEEQRSALWLYAWHHAPGPGARSRSGAGRRSAAPEAGDGRSLLTPV